jgi:hypothetical protein
MRHRLTIVAAILPLAGCGSVNRPAPLDLEEQVELASIRTRLADTTIVVASVGPSDAWKYAELFRRSGFRVADRANAAASDSPVVSIADTSTAPLGDGVLTWLTLGLIPSFGTYAHDFTVSVDRLSAGAPVETSTGWVFGWVGLAMSLLPAWEAEGAGWVIYGESPWGDRVVLDVMRSVAQRLGSK